MRVYPYGYAGKTKTELEYATWSVWQAFDPEFARRLRAVMEYAHDAGHPVGVGGGIRSTIGQLGLFLSRHHMVTSGGCCTYKGTRYALNAGAAHAAPPGTSYHEETTPDGKCLAADMVGDLAWINTRLGPFGLHHFATVNKEPWHWQPVDIPNGRSRYDAAVHHPLPVWTLPGTTPPPPTNGDVMTPDRRVLWDSRTFGGPVPAGNPIPLPIDGAGTHKAVTVKFTVVDPAANGYLTCGDDVADVNFTKGVTQSDTTVVPLTIIGTGRGIAFSCTAAAHIVCSLLAFND